MVALADCYAPDFAKGCAEDEKLSDILHKVMELSSFVIATQCDTRGRIQIFSHLGRQSGRSMD